MNQIEKLRKRLVRLERNAEKLDENSLPFKRLTKTYHSIERKIEKLTS